MRYALAVTVCVAVALALILAGQHFVSAQTYMLVVDPADPAAYATIQAAINEALTTYAGSHNDIYVMPGTYTESLVIPAAADIYLVAEPLGTPWNTIIQFNAASGMYATITVDANQTNPAYPLSVAGRTDRLRIQGFQIQGGPNGIHFTDVPIDPAGADFQTTVDGCYIRENTDNGVLVENAARPLLINCSIVKNGADGVRVSEDGIGTTSAFADLLFCTVAMNDDHGVYVESPTNNARVRDTIIYRNGDGVDDDATHPFDNPLQMEGGLVWQQNLFIMPTVGAYNVYTAVSIYGAGFEPTAGAIPDVYFGPPEFDGNGDGISDTLWRNANTGDDTDTQLNGEAPPSYLGAPGSVDVYIVRTDGFIYIVEDGFTYTEDTAAGGRRPYISQVIPEWGTIADTGNYIPDADEGNWIDVYGARFEEDCDVIFDFDGDFSTVGAGEHSPENEYSPRVMWRSSGRLHVKVPQHPNTYTPPAAYTLPHRVKVYVYNRESNEYTATGADYEFRAADNQPFIVEISPNYYRDLGGSDGSSGEIEPEGLLASVLGWNFMEGAVVKIGGIMCPYQRLIPRTSGATEPPLDELEGVRVPVSEFGAGGSYDVEVINPNGLHARLINGFTYYADSVPRANPSWVKWKPGNFARYAAASATYAAYGIYRTFLGSGFDTGLDISFTGGAVTETITPADATLGILPDEWVEQHRGHTQRLVDFRFPARPDAISATQPWFFNTPFPAPTYEVAVEIANHSDMNGDPSANAGSVTSNFFWTIQSATIAAGEGLFFDIENPGAIQIVRGATAAAPDRIRMPVLNWRNAMDVYVGEKRVTTYSGAPYVEPALGAAASIYFEVPAQDEGIYGPLDITVTLPDTSADNGFGELLYTMATSAYSYRFLYGNPYARAVVPKLVPENTITPPQTIYVLGSGFLGPVTANGIYTRMWLDWDAANTDDLTDGDEVPITSFTSPLMARYEVPAFDQIQFAIDLYSLPSATFPRNTFVDVVLEQFDATTATGPAVMNDSAGNPLRFRLEDGIMFVTTTPPRIDKVVRLAAPFASTSVPPYPAIDVPERRDGPVGGGTQLYIIGANFSRAGGSALDALVRIGGREARVLDIQPATAGFDVDGDGTADEFIAAETPPAPEGLPGTYDVTVISRPSSTSLLTGVAPEEQWFTYFMDGAPTVTAISPNHRSADDTETLLATIYGYNFDDVVWVTFSDPAAGTPSRVRVQYYSLSPTEIVVEVPLADAYPSALSYASGLANVEVTVQNRALDAAYDNFDDAAAAGLVSEAVDFYYYDDDRGDLEPAVPQLAFNDVYLNYNDYVNANPGTGSLSVDPMLDPGTSPPYPVGPYKSVAVRTPATWWLGKLAAVANIYGANNAYNLYWNPVADKAFMINIPPFTDFDLEQDTRPVESGIKQPVGRYGEALKPDIGADELSTLGNLSDAAVQWYFASVTPNPVGLLDADALQVVASIRGEMVGVESPVFFILPQGVVPAPPEVERDDTGFGVWLNTHAIRLSIQNVVYSAPDDATYTLTNSSAITTVIAGDILADGHAAVFFWIDLDRDNYVDITATDSEIIGWNPISGRHGDLSGGVSDGEYLIIDEAVAGRHLVIDTIPPRMFIESTTYGGDDLANVITADMIVPPAEHNDVYNALDVLAAQAALPLPVPPATPAALPRGDLWTPESVDAPLDYLGQIVYPAAGNVGVQVFFNVASAVGLYQTYPEKNLDPTIRVEFIDLPVAADPTAPDIFIDAFNAVSGDPDDYYTSSDRNRQLSAFYFDPVTPEDALDRGPARWRIGTGAHIIMHPNVLAETAFSYLASSANEGFHINNTAIPAVAEWQPYDYDDDDMIYGEELEAEWTFTDGVNPGIKWQLARDNFFHVATQFIGVDAALNMTGDDDVDNILDPLHLWWLIDVQTAIVNNAEGRTLRDPVITWTLNRTTDVVLQTPADAAAGPRPISTFRLWVADNYNDVYVPLTAWQPWSRRPIAADSAPLNDLYPTLDIEGYLTALGVASDLWRDKWLLVVVLSADEAGNVEPWPSGDLTLGAGDEVAVQASNGVNWMRFFNGGEGLLDTRIEAEFWYDTATDGVRASDAEYLGAVHRIPLHESDAMFIEAGFTFVVDPGAHNAGDIMVEWELLEDGATLYGPLAVDPWRPRRNQVVLPSAGGFVSFRTQVEADGQPKNYTLRATAYNTSTSVEDPTPATYSFTVIPTPKDFERVDSEDAQPIKIQEEQ